MQDRGTALRKTRIGLVPLSNEQTLHVEGRSDFMVVQRVADEQDLVARDGQSFQQRASQVKFRVAV